MMKTVTGILGIIFFVIAPSLGTTVRSEDEAVRFQAVDLFVDSGSNQLVAYQVEMWFDKSRVEVVGVEGGETGVFEHAPFYDPRGLAGGRLILAAYTTDHENAPRGRTRVARNHLRIEGNGEPELDVTLITAAKPGGERIKATVELEPAVPDTLGREEKEVE